MIQQGSNNPPPDSPAAPAPGGRAGRLAGLIRKAGANGFHSGLSLLSRILSSLHRTGMDQDIRRTRKFAARLARVMVLAVMSFRANQIPVRASALTYTSILSIVPFAVILSAVAGRFGYLDLLSRLVIGLASSMNLDINLDPVLDIIALAERVDFKQMGLVGSLGLLFTFFLAMGNIEFAIDHIWCIRKERNWWRRLKEYTPFLLLLVGMLVGAGNFLLEYRDYLTPKLYGDARTLIVHDTLFVLSTVGVLASTWAVMFLLYYLIPNTKVRFWPAALGASLSTLGIYGLARVMMEFPNLFITRTSFLYGSLAALPLFLLMIYLFWVVLLYGAAVAFIWQRLYVNLEADAEARAEAVAPFHGVEKDVLTVLKAIHALSGGSEAEGRRAVPLDTLAAKADLQGGYVESLCSPLVDLGLVTRRAVRDGPVYAPVTPLPEVDLSAIHSLLLRLDPTGKGRLRALNALDELKHTLGTLYSAEHLNPPLYLGAVTGETRRPSRNA